MRNAFAAELFVMAEKDDRIIMLSGDIGNRLFDSFKEHYPNRFINCGIAEANMISLAAGLALDGMRPIVYSIAPFVTTRCYEQIKLDICMHNAPVVIVGVGGGLSYAELGPSHETFEDIASLRALPGISIVCPASPMEVELSLKQAVELNSPAYIRIGKKGEREIHRAKPDFRIGKGVVIEKGDYICIIASGTVIEEALLAMQIIYKLARVKATVVDMHTIKPIDSELLDEIMDAYEIIATVEEHSLIGGLGGAVAEFAADRDNRKCRIIRMGISDSFLLEAGDQAHARRKFGLDGASIARKIIDIIYKSERNQRT